MTQRSFLARYRTMMPSAPVLGRPVDGRVVERCAFCSFQAVAPLEQARQAFTVHECDRPRPKTTA